MQTLSVLLHHSEVRMFRTVVTDGTIVGVDWTVTPSVPKTEGVEGYCLVGPFPAGTYEVEALVTLLDAQRLYFLWRVTSA